MQRSWLAGIAVRDGSKAPRSAGRRSSRPLPSTAALMAAFNLNRWVPHALYEQAADVQMLPRPAASCCQQRAAAAATRCAVAAQPAPNQSRRICAPFTWLLPRL